MTTLKDLVDKVQFTLYGYGLTQPRASFLTAPATSTDTVLQVADASNFDMGLAEIGGELVYIELVDRASNQLTVSPDGRGYYGTPAADYSTGTRVTFAPTWPRSRITQAINSTIAATYPVLYGVSQHQFTFTPARTTYELPAEAERVLRVEADTLGPSRQQQRINRYSFDSVAPSDDWATTNTITLAEAPAPGQTVTVTYAKAPSALSQESDALSVSGLRETASQAIVYGACAELVTFMDVSRLPVDTATGDELDDRNPLGMASRLGNQLQLRYEMELEKEAARLRATTKPTIYRSR